MKKRRKSRKGSFLAGVLLALILTAGGYCAGLISNRMAMDTHSGQPVAAFRAAEGRLEYSILGREGTLPYAKWGSALLTDVTALPAKGRLLYWGITAAGTWAREQLLPMLQQAEREFTASR